MVFIIIIIILAFYSFIFYKIYCIFILLGRPMNIQLATSDISSLGRLGGSGGLGGRRNLVRPSGNRPSRGNSLFKRKYFF